MRFATIAAVALFTASAEAHRSRRRHRHKKFDVTTAYCYDDSVADGVKGGLILMQKDVEGAPVVGFSQWNGLTEDASYRLAF